MSTTEDAGSETPGQRAARLRREKRQAKATNEDRLAKIKQLNGGTAPPEEVLGGPTTSIPAPTVSDPDEVDISTHSYGAVRSSDLSASAAAADDPMFRAMIEMQRQQAQQQQPRPGANPFAQQNASADQDDPMTKMLQQMMGMAGGDPNDPNNIHNTQDPMQMLSALMGKANAQNTQTAPPPSPRSVYVWKLMHAVFAIVIAGYIATTTTFSGSLLARTQSSFAEGSGDGLGSRLFLIFITAELGLQSARFFLEGGQLQGTGMLATISNIAPEPWAGYVRTAGRWSSILGSIVSDAMVIIFVLGVMAWWKGAGSIS